MPTISIITTVHNPVAEYLIAAHESVKAQKLPSGWTIEWLLQEDGGRWAEEILPIGQYVNLGHNAHYGPAFARNLALARCTGVYVKNLDQDDVLTEGVIARDIANMQQPGIRWTTSRVLDLMPDSTLVSFPEDPPHGEMRPGQVLEHWVAHDFRLPVHPTTMCIETELAVALGGWMAVPGSEDTGLLVAAATVASGWFDSTVGLHYRKHPDQQTAAPQHSQPEEWNARMQLIRARALAMPSLVRGATLAADDSRC